MLLQEARQILLCHPQRTSQQSRLQGSEWSLLMVMIPSCEGSSEPGGCLAVSDGKEAAVTRQHFPLLSPQCWDPWKVTKFLRVLAGLTSPLAQLCIHTHSKLLAQPTSLLFPCKCFNNPENGSTNIKYQINPQNWRRFPHPCSSCLPRLLQWTVLSIKGTSSKLMKHKNAFVRDTY